MSRRCGDRGKDRRGVWGWAAATSLLVLLAMAALFVARVRQPLDFLIGYPLERRSLALEALGSGCTVVYDIADDPEAVLQRLAVDAPSAGLRAQTRDRFVSPDGRIVVVYYERMLFVTRPASDWDRLEWWVSGSRQVMVPKYQPHTLASATSRPGGGNALASK